MFALILSVGFDAAGVYRMDDTWLDEQTFVHNLDQILGDKLYGHDQKKMIQKVEMRKEPEEKLTLIQAELMNFYSIFASSLKNIFGYVSYNNLQAFLEKTN